MAGWPTMVETSVSNPARRRRANFWPDAAEHTHLARRSRAHTTRRREAESHTHPVRSAFAFTARIGRHCRRRVQCNPAFVGLLRSDRHFTHAMSVSHDQTDVCLTRCRSNGTRPTSASRRRRCQCFFRHRVSQMSVRTAQTDVLMSRCRSRYNGPTLCQQTSVCVPRTAFT